MIENSSNIQRVCSFYVSNMHFVTMILPFINKQIKEKTKIITFFENNFTTNVELVLTRLTINEEEKRKLVEVNWKDTDVVKYTNVERILKINIDKNANNLIVVNGKENYINRINGSIERYEQKNHKRKNEYKIKVMNFYEVGNFNDNIREILDNHQAIFNTSGEHNIEDVFEGYEKRDDKIKVNK